DTAGRPLAASLSLVTVAAAQVDGGSATTTMVDLIGSPVAGEIWRLRIGELRWELVVGATIEGIVVDTTAEIAAALAAMLNADAAAVRYTALADGARIVIVDRLGGVFETLLQAGDVTRAEGYADIQLDYELGADELQAKLRALYGFDDLV